MATCCQPMSLPVWGHTPAHGLPSWTCLTQPAGHRPAPRVAALCLRDLLFCTDLVCEAKARPGQTHWI